MGYRVVWDGMGGIVRRRMEWGGIGSCEMGYRVVRDGVSSRVGWGVESCGMGVERRRMEWGVSSGVGWNGGYRVVKESDCVD